MENTKFDKLNYKTISDYAVEKSWEELCRLLSVDYGVKFSNEAKTFASKLGGTILSLVQPRLLGKILDVGPCSICDEEGALYTLDCHHSFCYICCSMWVKEQISSLQIKCPHKDCLSPILINHIQMLLSEEDYEAHLNVLLRQYLATSDQFKWCPNTNCTNGIFIQDQAESCSEVDCPACRVGFCFKCGSLAHYHMSCEEAVKDKENMVWKWENTKQCPNCKSSIQKNEGCSHMTCVLCDHEFCWICLGNYIPGRLTFESDCPCK